jgi:DNA-binding IclR family transcriptional regulator
MAHEPLAWQLAQELGFERRTRYTTTDVDVIAQQLEEVRGTGYAWVKQEREVGLSSVAAPVWGSESHRLIAAIGIYGPSFRVDEPGAIDGLAVAVMEAAADLSLRMGHPPVGRPLP